MDKILAACRPIEHVASNICWVIDTLELRPFLRSRKTQNSTLALSDQDVADTVSATLTLVSTISLNPREVLRARLLLFNDVSGPLVLLLSVSWRQRRHGNLSACHCSVLGRCMHRTEAGGSNGGNSGAAHISALGSHGFEHRWTH
jgi:hypothetical protein